MKMIFLMTLFLAVVAEVSVADAESATVTGKAVCGERCSVESMGINGQIDSSTVVAVQKLLGEAHAEASRKKKTMWGMSADIAIDSPGGSVTAAMSIGRILRREQNGVTVAGVCNSACVLILAGAVTRSYFANQVGIHRPYLEVPQRQVTPDFVRDYYGRMLQDIRVYLKEMNVTEQLADAMLRIDPQNIRYLTREEGYGYGLTSLDPIFRETLELQKAQLLGISRLEYLRRKTLANNSCTMPPMEDNSRESDSRWSVCVDETLKTGRVPAQGRR